MALKDLTILQSQLLTSGLQNSNPALYQVISELIKVARDLQAIVGGNSASIVAIEADIAEIFAANFLMSIDESGSFPNSRELLAGTNVEIDNTIANESTISVQEHDEEEISDAIFPDFSFTGNPWGGDNSPFSSPSPFRR